LQPGFELVREGIKTAISAVNLPAFRHRKRDPITLTQIQLTIEMSEKNAIKHTTIKAIFSPMTPRTPVKASPKNRTKPKNSSPEAKSLRDANMVVLY
jgi:hypothetical protein